MDLDSFGPGDAHIAAAVAAQVAIHLLELHYTQQLQK